MRLSSPRLPVFPLLPMLFLLAGSPARSGAADAAPATTDAGYHVLQSFVLGGDGGWDLLTVDPDARRLYIARSTRIMVMDAESGKLLKEMPGSGVHGIALVPETGKGFFTNGKTNSVSLFDLKTLTVTGQVAVGTKPDAIIYDQASKHVIVCNNGGTDLSVLAPDTGAVLATIDVGGAPELVAVDGKGRLYTNLEDKDQLGVVDTLGMKAIGQWPLAPGNGPSGVAVDAAHHRAFSVCHGSKTLEIFDTDSGKVLFSPAIGPGADGCVFDPSTGMIFSPNGDGTISVIHEDDSNTFTLKQTATSKPYARTIAFDEKTRHLYLVTADPKPTPPGTTPPHGRPQFLPDTFVVLVVGR